jgi:hypothetical protein
VGRSRCFSNAVREWLGWITGFQGSTVHGGINKLVLLPFRQQYGMLVEHVDGMSGVGIEGCRYHILVISVVIDTIDTGDVYGGS